MFTNPAIIFNCSYNGLSIIQELSSKGINCVAMDSIRGVGAFSLFAKYVKCPDPLTNETQFISFLYNYCKKMSIKPVLFPTNDEWAHAISKYKEILESVSFPCVADFEVVDIVINKDQFYQLGNENNFLTPITWSWNKINQIVEYPIIAKPKFRALSGNKKINLILKKIAKSDLRLVVIHQQTELNRFILDNEKLKDMYIFQEFVEGLSDRMFTIGIYANRKSEVLGCFTGRKVRGYPAEYGDCIVGENYNVPNELIENTFRIVKELNYSGIAEFEYKQDNRTKKFKLIEINPRAWSWIGITPYCGVNLPLIAYKDMIGINSDPVRSKTYENGSVKYVKIYQDFVNCLFRYKRTFPTWKMSYAKWKTSIMAEKVIYAELHRKDLFVSIVSIVYAFLKLMGKK